MVVVITITIYTSQPEVPYTLLNGPLLSEELSNLLLSTSCLEVLRTLSRWAPLLRLSSCWLVIGALGLYTPGLVCSSVHTVFLHCSLCGGFVGPLRPKWRPAGSLQKVCRLPGRPLSQGCSHVYRRDAWIAHVREYETPLPVVTNVTMSKA